MTVPWDALDRLIDTLDSKQVSDHGLAPLLARRLRRQGLQLPEALFREERAASAANLVAPSLLARVRDAYDGRLLLLKGPEVALRYPDRARRFGDIDLVVEDSDAAQSALLAAGFQLQEHAEWPPRGWEYMGRGYYHLQPLRWPGLALTIEIHRRVNWPVGLVAPSNAEIFEAAVPSALGVEGLLAPSPDHHAILLASHAWAEGPMRRLRDLIDVMVFVDDSRRDELRRLAKAWGVERGWSATLQVADWLLYQAEEPKFVRLWARYLRDLREPTVAETHIQSWLSPFWVAPPRIAARQAGAAVGRDLRPVPGQTWGAKLRQTMRALFHPFSPESVHAQRSQQSSGTSSSFRDHS